MNEKNNQNKLCMNEYVPYENGTLSFIPISKKFQLWRRLRHVLYNM